MSENPHQKHANRIILLLIDDVGQKVDDNIYDRISITNRRFQLKKDQNAKNLMWIFGNVEKLIYVPKDLQICAESVQKQTQESGLKSTSTFMLIFDGFCDFGPVFQIHTNPCTR